MSAEQKNRSFDAMAYLLPMVGGACLVAGLAWAMTKQEFSTPSYALIGAGMALFLTIFVRAEKANIQYYLHVFFYSAMVGGICVVGYLFARQYTQQFDLTQQHLHTLSPATVQFLKKLDRDVTVTVFIATAEPFERVEALYNGYTNKLEWRFEDPVKNPLAARELGDRVNQGDIFFVCGDNKKRINALELDPQFIMRPVMAENTITNALLEVTRQTKPKMYFLSGHGEVQFEAAEPPRTRNPQQKPPPSLAAVREELERRGIRTEELDLVGRGAIPEDASVVVIAGPRRDLFDPELAALRTFLTAGGKLLVLIDPVSTSRMESLSLTNLRLLLGEYGIDAPDDLIFDLQALRTMRVDPPVFPMMASFDAGHPVTASLVSGMREFLMGPTRPLRKGKVPADMTYTELVKSSPESWSMKISEVSDRMALPSKDRIEPQTLGVAVGKQPPPRIPGTPTPELAKNNTRLAVFGSSLLMRDDFLTNSNLGVLLMLNTVNWLTESEDMIAIPPRQIEGTPILLEVWQGQTIFFIVAVFLPAALFFGGVSYSVVRRRH
jgi:hypothetical protein